MIAVITHNKRFHADEIVGYTILKLLYGDLIKLFRVDHQIDIDSFIFHNCGDSFKKIIVLDVSRMYHIGSGIFGNIDYLDHHHTTLYRDNGNVLATAGLVWKHYGKNLLKRVGVRSAHIDQIWQTIDHTFIAPIDAIDADGEYRVNMVNSGEQLGAPTISSYIAKMNMDSKNELVQLEQFEKCSQFLASVLLADIERQKRRVVDEKLFLDSLELAGDHFVISEIYVANYALLMDECDICDDPWYVAMEVDTDKYMVYSMPTSRTDRRPKYPILDLCGVVENGGFIHENRFCSSGTRDMVVKNIKLNVEHYKKNENGQNLKKTGKKAK